MRHEWIYTSIIWFGEESLYYIVYISRGGGKEWIVWILFIDLITIVAYNSLQCLWNPSGLLGGGGWGKYFKKERG